MRQGHSILILLPFPFLQLAWKILLPLLRLRSSCRDVSTRTRVFVTHNSSLCLSTLFHPFNVRIMY
jgi:hypothetical protein